MSKKNKQNVKFGVTFVVIILGIAASFLLTLNAFSTNYNNSNSDLNGLMVAFGGKWQTTGAVSVTLGTFKFNLLLVIAMLLPAGAAVINGILNNKLGSLVAVGLFLLNIILMLVIKEVSFTPIIGNAIKIQIKLSTLGIISLVLSGLGLLATGYKLSLDL